METNTFVARPFYWEYMDRVTDEGKKFTIIAFAQTPEEEVVALYIHDYEPWIEIVLPKEMPSSNAETISNDMMAALRRKLWGEGDKDHRPTRHSVSMRYPNFYYSDQEQIVIEVHFAHLEAARHCQNLLQWPIVTHSYGPIPVFAAATKIDPLTKYHAEVNIRATDWIEFTGTPVTEHHTKCQREYQVSWNNVKQCSDEICNKLGEIHPSFLVFDHEMYAKIKMAFPDEHLSSDVLFMTGLLHFTWSSQLQDYEVQEYLLVLTKLSKEEFGRIKGSKLVRIDGESKVRYEVRKVEDRDVEVLLFKSEMELLNTFESFLDLKNPTGVIGHNSNEFDFKYHKVRKGRQAEPFSNMSRIKNWNQNFKHIEWSSSAYHDQDIWIPDGPGRIYFDTMKMVQRDYKEDSYSLDALCQDYLGIGKHKWSPEMIFLSYTTQDAEMMRTTGEYCMQDVWCTWGLFVHFNFWTSYSGMSNVMGVAIFDLFSQGQSIRTRTQIFRECYVGGYYMHAPADRVFRQIAGGFVFKQNPGLNEWILLFDFAGLYPSIMRKFNISTDTFDKYKLAPDKDCYIMRWKDDHGDWETRFVKETVVKGILPKLLEKLTNSREQSKKLMSICQKAGDTRGAMRHNVEQLAKKTSANSAYGGISMKGGELGLSEAGAAVTAYGRMLVQKMAAWFEKEGWRIVYGDTDSNMVQRIKPLTDEEKMNFKSIGKELVARLNKECFEDPIKVELDGAFRVMLGLARKMYCFISVDDKNPLGINEKLFKSKGAVSARRDTCLMCRKLYARTAVEITKLTSLDVIISEVANEIERLIRGDVSVEELVTIVKLGSHYANANYPLAIYQRHLHSHNMVVKPGSRLPHLYVIREGARYKGEKFEHPDIYEKNKETMKIDRLLYLESQFANKLDSLLHASFPTMIPDEFLSKVAYAVREHPQTPVLMILVSMMQVYQQSPNRPRCVQTNHVCSSFGKLQPEAPEEGNGGPDEAFE